MTRGRFWFTGSVTSVVSLVIVFSITMPEMRLWLFSRVTTPDQDILQGKLTLTIPDDEEPGVHQFKVDWHDPVTGKSLGSSRTITMEVLNKAQSGGGSGGGTGGGSDDVGAPDIGGGPRRTYSWQTQQDHQISGSYSKVLTDGSRRVAKLAGSRDMLAKKVAVPKSDYWFFMNARHDRPGPVRLAVYLNDRAWKVVTLNKADDKYRTHRVGLLRNFLGGKIHFRLLNDVYDRKNPANEATDRNLFISHWGLSTDSGIAPPPPKTSGISRSTGWQALPNLNNVIREELGGRHVNFNTWRYYAHRLTLKIGVRGAIDSEAQLRNVMRYWKGVRPNLPRGDN